MNIRRIMTVGVASIGLAIALTGCSEPQSSGDETEQEFTERQQQHFNVAQPPHAYDASQARANLIAAHDAMALGANTWTTLFVEGVGITFQCPSVGYPIPFGTNLTNPDKIDGNREGGYITTPQMEPYGLYPPQDVPATLANCVLPNGEVGIFYAEPAIVAYGFTVTCDRETHYCEIPANSDATVVATRVDPEQVNVRPAGE